MQNPEIILTVLSEKACKNNYKFDRIYRILYNPEMYVMAYSNIYKNDGSSTPGVDGETASGFNEEKIFKLIESLKRENYQPKPAKRIYIEKKDKSKKRPLGIPSFSDRIIQEICRSILEVIYEPNFSTHSHGFRHGKSCHTALSEVSKIFTGVNWFIEGDIKGFFDNINHHELIKLLKKRIIDDKFIRLIWKFIKAGYLEDWKFHNTYTGTPQGGIISPILANIYLNELDKFYENELRSKFNKGDRKSSRRRNPVYRALEYQISQIKKKINNCVDNDSKLEMYQNEKELRKKMLNTPHLLPDTEGHFKRIKYVRYADDFLIGINGSKNDCKEIKKHIKDYLEQELKLELSEDKTLITHSKKKARFLGYDITVGNNDKAYKNINGTKVRNARKNIRLYMPNEVIRNFIVDNNLVRDINEKRWMPISRNRLRNLSELEIVSTYNAEIRGLYNYYKMADNVTTKMWQLRYVMEYSCLKTLSSKHDSSVRKELARHRNGKFWGVSYKTKKGNAFCYFYKDGFYKSKRISKVNIDSKPNLYAYRGRTELEKRISAKTCEICGTENISFHIHHVHRMKDLKGKEPWEIEMLGRRRKTLVVCIKCHQQICHP